MFRSFVGFVCAFFVFVAGVEASLPNLINFQSVLTDDGGNRLADGKYSMLFQILDSEQAVLYEEKQEVEAVEGVVSVMVGAGIDPKDGAPTGGLLLEDLDPSLAKYLSVQVEEYPKQILEITSVPFSLYSEKAYSLMPKSVHRDHLADGLIEDILSQKVLTLSELPEEVVTSDELPIFYQNNTGASQIGVSSGLNYSTGTSIQLVLNDLDSAMSLQSNRIDSETSSRIADVLNLDNRLTQEVSSLSTEDQTIRSEIDLCFPRGGGAMEGPIDMSRFRIINIGDPVSELDVARLRDINTALAGIARPFAWGFVNSDANGDGSGGPGDVAVTGYNVSGVTFNAVAALQNWTISFTQNPPNANYIVLVTPKGSFTTKMRVDNQTPGSFEVKHSEQIPERALVDFSFLVMLIP